jgi:hypothetical protein
MSLPTLTRLTSDQITTLKILFRQGFDRRVKCGAIDEPARGTLTKAFADWCHTEQLEACGVASMKDCDQSHWRDLCGRALLLNGHSGQAFAMILKATPGHADRELQLFLLEKALEHSEGKLTMGYAVVVARGKFKVRSLDDCTAKQLQQLVWTVINRGNAKLGKGKTWNRNKSQKSSQKAGARSQKPGVSSEDMPERPLDIAPGSSLLAPRY